MEYQYSKKYNPIAEFGCAFISCGAWAEEKTGQMTKANIVNEVYAECVDKLYMEANCFIGDWEGVMNTFTDFLGNGVVQFKYIGWWNKGNPVHFEKAYTSADIDAEILRVETPWGYHFKTPGFNPYPELAQGTEVNGRRYFKVI